MMGIFTRSDSWLHRFVNAGLAVVLATVLCTGLSACSPSGAAVGDTQTLRTTQEHDGVDRADLRLVVIGADSAASHEDSELMSELNASHITAVYSSAANVRDGLASTISDAVGNRPSMILVHAGQRQIVSDPTSDRALRQARMAGVPVAMLSERPIGVDKTLYAARLAYASSEDCLGRAVDAGSLVRAIQQIVDDVPHRAVICLGTENSE